jgi:hypothetical protein
VEIRIPVTGPTPRDAGLSRGLVGAKPSSKMPWFFNVCRQRVRVSEEKQLQAFSPTDEPSFHVREESGELYVK